MKGINEGFEGTSPIYTIYRNDGGDADDGSVGEWPKNGCLADKNQVIIAL